MSNDNLILVVGKSSTGKSMCLRNLPNQEGVIYLNTESGKKLPFPNKFKKKVITDPYQVYTVFQQAEQMPEVHTIVVDSVTYLMQMFEQVHVKTAPNTLQAWGAYNDYFVNLMQQHVAKSTKNVIFTAHTQDKYNEKTMDTESFVKVAGKLMDNGIESWFSQIVSCKVMPTLDLLDHLADCNTQSTALLNIDEDEEIDGYKHVFQTRKTKKTTGERIRGPLKMWSREETYIDNDIQLVLDRVKEYYAED